MAQCKRASWTRSFFSFDDSSTLCGREVLASAESSMPTSLGHAVLPLIFLLGFMTAALLWARSRRRQRQQGATNRSIICVKSLYRTATSLSSDTTASIEIDHDDTATNNSSKIHLIFLVHGWLGVPKDLAYLEEALRQEASQQEHESIVVYNCQFNFGVGRTHDGIQAGATRVAEEIRHVIHKLYHASNKEPEISLSLVGFSLGGLYIRYALPLVFGQPQQQPTQDPLSSKEQQLDNADDDTEQEEEQHALMGGFENSNRRIMIELPAKLKLKPKIFCSIATPHLGCRGHSVIPIPRCCYRFLTNLTQTKRDLFFHSDLLYQTMTDKAWIEPLQKFDKRLAYANSFRTDIMVPTCTAAFVSPHNPTVHATYHSNQDATGAKASNKLSSCIVLTVQTKHDQEQVDRNIAEMQQLSIRNDPHELDRHMSQALDAMGWTKVFCDLSHCNLPSWLAGGCNKMDTSCKSRWKSSELLATFGKARRRFFFPFAHDYIIVNSKNTASTYMNRGGKPVVEHFARNFIQDILDKPSEHGDGTDGKGHPNS